MKKQNIFFNDKETQTRLEVSIMTKLSKLFRAKGRLGVLAVLVRDITLPTFITKAIEQKKVREQEVEKQKAELERF